MSTTTLTLPHLTPDLRVYLGLYTNLRNAHFLRSQLLAGNPKLEYAFIDATTILSTTHLLAAIFRACNDYHNDRLRSRNIHSEIVYCLGYNNNIANTLNAFGITDSSTEMIVLKVSVPSWGLNEDVSREGVEKHLHDVIEGEEVGQAQEKLGSMADLEKVRKIYRLGGSDAKVGKARRRKDGSLEGGSTTTSVEASKMDGAAQDERTHRDSGAARQELEIQVLGLMALRGAV